jgi:hypothetical protein
MVDYFKYPLDGCRERVRRAEEHLRELEREVASMVEKQAHALPFDLDQEPPHGAIKVGRPPETFAGIRFGTLVGEITYNLRCALDYLIYALAVLDSGSDQKGTQFPILDAAKDFAGRGKTMLKGLNAAHVAAIERLQPYQGCHWTGRLRDLSNMDKHRHIVPGGGIMKATVHSGLSTDLSRIRGAFDRKAKHPLTGEEVDVKVHIASEILFSDGSPVIQPLYEIKARIADTLRQFEPEFKP